MQKNVDSVVPFSNALKDLNNEENPYFILEKIGHGGYAEVFRCVEKTSRKEYAMKIIDETKFCLKELNIISSLHHPFIVQFQDSFSKNGQVYLIMEYVKGGELYDLVSEKRMSEKEALYYFKQICSAIQYLHRQDIVHGDIKVENILIDMNQKIAKLCDFGAAAEKCDHPITSICCTLEYAAPETFGATCQMTKPMDIWSLGVLLFIMVTSSFPFSSRTPTHLIAKIKHGKIEYPYFLSSSLKSLFTQMFSIDPFRRISIDELCLTTLF